MDIALWQWVVGGVAALIVGCAKTGVPGLGLLAVPLMALAFGGRASVGTLLPMLIVADCFAVLFYRRHVQLAQWGQLWRLFPAVAFGLALGFCLMWWLALRELQQGAPNALFAPLLGAVILLMLALLLLRKNYGNRLVPQSRAAVLSCGSVAGVATFLANAAGPIMAIYLAGMRLSKEQFMGTNAWFFLILNVSKVPLFVILGLLVPKAPLITAESLVFNALMAPLIIVGVFAGKWLFYRLAPKLFEVLVLLLAAAAAVHLLFS